MNLVHLTMRPWFIPIPGQEEHYKVTALNKGGRKLVQKQTALLSLKLLPQTLVMVRSLWCSFLCVDRRLLCLATDPQDTSEEDTASPTDPRVLQKGPEPERR